jgi:hypothetical protein
MLSENYPKKDIIDQTYLPLLVADLTEYISNFPGEASLKIKYYIKHHASQLSEYDI